MNEIKLFILKMENVLNEIKEYYLDYLSLKNEYPKLSSINLEMAKLHLDLFSKWHNMACNVVSEIKSTNKNDETLIIWNYEKEKLCDAYNELKYKINNN